VTLNKLVNVFDNALFIKLNFIFLSDWSIFKMRISKNWHVFFLNYKDRKDLHDKSLPVLRRTYSNVYLWVFFCFLLSYKSTNHRNPSLGSISSSNLCTLISWFPFLNAFQQWPSAWGKHRHRREYMKTSCIDEDVRQEPLEPWTSSGPRTHNIRPRTEGLACQSPH
jgi:hypothetical protein